MEGVAGKLPCGQLLGGQVSGGVDAYGESPWAWGIPIGMFPMGIFHAIPHGYTLYGIFWEPPALHNTNLIQLLASISVD